jgi:hypothetical protein
VTTWISTTILPWLLPKLNDDAYPKFYSPSEHLATDEVIVLFKGRVSFKQYFPKEHKHFGTKIYTLCDTTDYALDMTHKMQHSQ